MVVIVKNKIIALCLVFTVCSSVVAYADTDIDSARAKYYEYQETIDKVTAEVVKFNSAIEENISLIEQNNNSIADLNTEIENTKKAIDTLEKDIAEQEAVKDKRIRELYKSGGSASYLALLFDASGLQEFLDKLDMTRRLVDIDKRIVEEVAASKESLERNRAEQDKRVAEIEALNKDIQEKMVVLEEQKAQQQAALDLVQSEQDKFGAEVLDIAEREVVQPQFALIDSSWDDLDGLNSAINQLIAIRDNQLVSPTVIQEVTDKIALAHDRAEELKASQYNIPNRGVADATGNAIVDYAYQFLGSPYVWGAVGPDSFDCSGFTSYVYRHAAGMEITRTTYTQIEVGQPVSYDEMQPGDLVFTYGNEHVGIYVGNGQYINATYPGSTVRVTPVTSFYAARRLL